VRGGCRAHTGYGRAAGSGSSGRELVSGGQRRNNLFFNFGNPRGQATGTVYFPSGMQQKTQKKNCGARSAGGGRAGVPGGGAARPGRGGRRAERMRKMRGRQTMRSDAGRLTGARCAPRSPMRGSFGRGMGGGHPPSKTHSLHPRHQNESRARSEAHDRPTRPPPIKPPRSVRSSPQVRGPGEPRKKITGGPVAPRNRQNTYRTHVTAADNAHRGCLDRAALTPRPLGPPAPTTGARGAPRGARATARRPESGRSGPRGRASGGRAGGRGRPAGTASTNKEKTAPHSDTPKPTKLPHTDGVNRGAWGGWQTRGSRGENSCGGGGTHSRLLLSLFPTNKPPDRGWTPRCVRRTISLPLSRSQLLEAAGGPG
jgi:hypothetical protein